MTRFQRAEDPDRAGQLLLRDGEPVGLAFWAHDYADRSATGWFLSVLDANGEEDDDGPRRLAVSPDVEALVADRTLERGEWLARAETVELVTAPAALAVAEVALADALG